MDLKKCYDLFLTLKSRRHSTKLGGNATLWVQVSDPDFDIISIFLSRDRTMYCYKYSPLGNSGVSRTPDADGKVAEIGKDGLEPGTGQSPFIIIILLVVVVWLFGC